MIALTDTIDEVRYESAVHEARSALNLEQPRVGAGSSTGGQWTVTATSSTKKEEEEPVTGSSDDGLKQQPVKAATAAEKKVARRVISLQRAGKERAANKILKKYGKSPSQQLAFLARGVEDDVRSLLKGGLSLEPRENMNVRAQIVQLAMVPRETLRWLGSRGVNVRLGEKSAGEMAAITDAEVAKAWGGIKLDQVGGLYLSGKKTALAGGESGRDGIITHELGHALGFETGLHEQPDWLAAHQASGIFAFENGPQELFAQATMYWWTSGYKTVEAFAGKAVADFMRAKVKR